MNNLCYNAQDFFDLTSQTNLGQLTIVRDLISSDPNVARVMISNFTPQNHLEENSRSVYQIYLDTWSNGIEDFDVKYPTGEPRT